MAREISRLYRELAEVPAYTSAYFLKSGAAHSTIRVTTSVRDHLRSVKRTLSKHIISVASHVEVTSSQDDSALASVPSPSGKRLGVLREISEGSSKKRFVEVWLGNRLEAMKEVTKTHEAFHLNPLFFSLSFSRSESSFVYTAEARMAEATDTSPDMVSKFRFAPDFGERHIGKKKPTLYLFRWNTQKYDDQSDKTASEEEEATSQTSPVVVALKPSLPEDSSFVFGQASFAPDQGSIFATGYEETADGRRLGVVGCWNRPSSIFKLVLPTEFPEASEEISVHVHRLTSPEISARSPRVTDAAPGEPYLIVWLANPVGGPHASCTSLHALRSDEDKSKILVDYVSDPTCQESGSFPGLYVDQLPSQPFLSLPSDSEAASHLVTHSTWGSRQTVLGISLTSGTVHDLTPDLNHTWAVSGTDGKRGLLAVRSALNSPHELVETRLQTFQAVRDWRVIDKPQLTAWAREKLNTLEWSVRPIPGRFPTEIIVLQMAGTENQPLVTIPHGGPHAAYVPEFNPSTVALALEGYIISLVNYTGSLGFGQRYVDALIGQAGTLDVQDCYESAKYLIEIGLAREGPGKQFVQGGSHGGFLSAHLVGQYPDFFSATVMRNPVIAAGEIASVSDIPDWAFCEFGTAFGPRSIITSEVFGKLQNASPIAYVDTVMAPVLLLTGETDQRVPPSQSKNYYHALKGRGKEVEMLMFPSNGHSLDSVEAERVSWEAGRNWFARFKEN